MRKLLAECRPPLALIAGDGPADNPANTPAPNLAQDLTILWKDILGKCEPGPINISSPGLFILVV